MSLVPMNLSFVDRPIQKTYSRLALSLPPTSGTVPPPQPSQLSDRPPHRDGLNVADRANDLEVHRVKLACRFRPPELSQSPNDHAHRPERATRAPVRCSVRFGGLPCASR